MECDGISFGDALKLASDLERITREAKLGAKPESSVSMVRNSTSKSSSSRPPYTKNCTSKPASNNTSSAGARQQQPTRSKPNACWNCGFTWNKRADCKYLLNGYKCNECGEVGHKATVCPRHSKSSRGGAPAQQSHGKDRRVHATAADDDSDSVTIHSSCSSRASVIT